MLKTLHENWLNLRPVQRKQHFLGSCTGPAEPPPEPSGRMGPIPDQGPRLKHRGVFFYLETILMRVATQH